MQPSAPLPIRVLGNSDTLPQDREPTLTDLQVMVERNFSVLWEYRFFYRELVALMRRDPEFGRRYRGRV
jgi:Bacterial transcriptional repressor